MANESLFAIIFKYYKELEEKPSNSHINCAVSHLADWKRMSSATSPHIFKDADEEDIKFIDRELESNFYAMFIRKVSPEFPDEILRYYIFKEDNELILIEPNEFFIQKCKKNIYYLFMVCFLLYISIYYLFL